MRDDIDDNNDDDGSIIIGDVRCDFMKLPLIINEEILIILDHCNTELFYFYF